MKLADAFERETRDNGDRFVTLKDDAPDWLREAVYDAHKGSLPDDWVFETCYHACLAIDDGMLTEEETHGFCEGEVDIYTRPLFQWAADCCLSPLWSEAEERAEELGEGGAIVGQLQRIQYCAIEQIASIILAAHAQAQEGAASE